jgi:hypothetical protein
MVFRKNGTGKRSEKVRSHFHKSTKNLQDEAIDFDECCRSSTLIDDPSKDISFRVPSIDDLIRLKKIRKPNVKDEQDIEFLLKARKLRKP